MAKKETESEKSVIAKEEAVFIAVKSELTNSLKDLNSEPLIVAIKNDIESFKSMSGEVDSQDKVEECFALYNDIVKRINTIGSLKDYEETVVSSKVSSLTEEANSHYLAFLRKYNQWSLKEMKNMNDLVKKNQVLQFSVSSIVMTILTFLLANISVISASGQLSLRLIVITNLILLLVSFVLFGFIGVFLGFIEKSGDSKRWRRVKRIALLAIPLIILAAIIVLAIIMEK